MDNKKITATLESQGERLDKFLAAQFPETTRSQIKIMILDGLVLVNDKPAKVHQFLKDGDEVKIMGNNQDTRNNNQKTEKLQGKANAKPESRNIKAATKEKLFSQIKIIEDKDDFLIIEKPARLLVHSTDKGETDTLVDWLLSKYPELRQIGDDPQRPAIVHRLDKDVSGLMVIPKTQEAFEYFKKQFKLRTLTKKYTALVHGQIERDEDDITFAIGRSKSNPGLFAARSVGQLEEFSGKPAHTKFNVTKRFVNHTLLEVQILTGRTHQIRVHLLAYGHPIVGDPLYGKKPNKELGRIFLHANHLSFTGPDAQEYAFESPLPEALASFLESLS